MDKIHEAIERIQRMRDEAEMSQLITYVKNVTLSELTEDELRSLGYADYLANDSGRKALESLCVGYDAAAQLSIERLRELFEADDWGSAWELHDGEDNEYHYSDEGAMQAYDRVLDVLTVLAHGLTPAQGSTLRQDIAELDRAADRGEPPYESEES